MAVLISSKKFSSLGDPRIPKQNQLSLALLCLGKEAKQTKYSRKEFSLKKKLKVRTLNMSEPRFQHVEIEYLGSGAGCVPLSLLWEAKSCT